MCYLATPRPGINYARIEGHRHGQRVHKEHNTGQQDQADADYVAVADFVVAFG